jgi:gliding motility-associated lipoprotein GldH
MIIQKRMNKKVFIFSALLLVFLSSCMNQPVYEKSYSFKNNKWEINAKPTFKVDIQDTSKTYDFTITFRTTTDYEYNNVWFYLNSITPSGEKAREPFEMKITNTDGSWIGKKTGTIVETELFFKSRKLERSGIYSFYLEQGITEHTLKNVLDVGLRVDFNQAD